MKSKTLGDEMERLRLEHGITYREMGALAAMSESLAHKACNGRPVRWESIHLMLENAFRIRHGSPKYQAVHRLWLNQRAEIAAQQPVVERTLSKEATEVVRKFRILVRDMKPDEMKRVLEAATEAAKAGTKRARR